MKKDTLKAATIGLGVLAISYLIVRIPLFYMLGSNEWYTLMTLLSAALIGLFLFEGKHIAGYTVSFAYLPTYLLAYLLHTESLDAGGGTITNTWWLWTLLDAIVILIALIVEKMFHVEHSK